MLPTPEPTADQDVDGGDRPAAPTGGTESGAPSALDRLDATLTELATRPLSEQADGYDRLHADLQAALTEIDGA